jgi:hypothetical protein
MNTLIGLLPFVIVGCHFIDKWYLSIGRLWVVYAMTVLGSLITILFNVLLYTYQDCTKSVLVFSLTSGWSIVMAIKGIHRLVKASKHQTQRQDGLRFDRGWSW